MKKAAILLLFNVCIIPLSLPAQSIYIKPGAGYGFGIQGQAYNYTSSYYFENPDTSYTLYAHESVKLSLGKGMKFGFTLGKEFDKHLGFEIASEYSNGKSGEYIVYSNGRYDYDQIYSVEFTDKYSYDYKSVQIAPGLIIRGGHRKVLPFLKLGAVIGFSCITENYESSLYNSIPSYYPFESWTHIIKNNWTPSVGLVAATGFEFKLANDFYAFCEFKYTTLNSSPKKGEMTEYTYRGEDKLESLKFNERNFEYVDAYNDSDNKNPDVAGKRLAQPYSLSNISMFMGFKMTIKHSNDTQTK